MAGETILLVDDDMQVRKLLEVTLTRAGYRLRLAGDGLEALSIVRDELPDLVLTDVTMPNMNGLELTRRLRSNHKTARIPILVLSAMKQESDVLAGYAEGADDYVGKPVELAILRAKIETLLRRAPVAPAVSAEAGSLVLFLHGKGGVGATTLAVNVAAAMIDRSPDRVAVLDLNPIFGSTDVLLDVRSPKPLTALADIQGEVDEETFEAFVTPHQSGLRLVVANQTPELAERFGIPTAQLAIDRLRRRYDFVVADLPANFSEPNLAALDEASVACIVTSPSVPAMKAGRECLEVLDKVGFPLKRTLLVANRIQPEDVGVENVERFFKRAADVVIGYSPLFPRSADAGRPLVLAHPSSPPAKEVRKLADAIADRMYEGPRA